MSNTLHYMTAAELSDAFRQHTLSPMEAASAVLDRIERLNPILNCYCHLDRETTLAQARESEARWMRDEPRSALDGVPVSIKDLLPTKGWPTRYGSRAIDPAGPWDEDDPAVTRLREAGAILLGKTTTPEFGNSGVTNSPLTGLTVNPWDTNRTTGGSSGGSAAAVAAGLGPLSVGTDAGGSIRTPPSFCGVVGMKPTFGRVAQYPNSDWGGLSVSGPIARTVRDAALMMNAIARPDFRDWNALPDDGRDYLQDIDSGIKGLRVAYSADLGFMPVNAEVAEIVRKAAIRFEELGAHVELADPGFGDPIPIFNDIWAPIAASAVAFLTDEQRALLGDEMRDCLAEASRIDLKTFLSAQQRRADLARNMKAFHERFDLLLTPTAIVTPFENKHHMPPEWDTNRSWLWELATFSFNFSRQPAITVPCGFSSAGLPIGLQIVGRIYEDAAVLRAAHVYQKAYPTLHRKPVLD